MRKPLTAIVIVAAIVSSLMALPRPARAGCWGCWVVPGTSHAFVYGSIYGPQFAYPAYSEYGYGFYGYAPRAYYYGGHYAPYLFVHHSRHAWRRAW
jgi:hypothetical protein